ARQVNAENIFAFAQIGGFENLLALQRAVGLHLDLAQAIVGIFEEEPLRSETHAEKKSGANSGREPDFRNHDKHATVAMPRGLVRTHADIEKMLLAALARIGDALISGPRALRGRSHFFDRALDRSMMRAHSCA